jgi:general secretion pathway protein E
MASLLAPAAIRQQQPLLIRGLSEELSRNGPTTTNTTTTDNGHVLAELLLRDALRERATDIHLDPQDNGTRIRFRIDGALIDAVVLGREQGARLVRHFKAMCGMDVGNVFGPASARLTQTVEGHEVDLRFASAPSISGEKLSVRLLDRNRVGQRLDELGLADEQREQIEQWVRNASGMFLVSGPTGSGKTTTLYALLHELRLHDRSVITVEDPVEYKVEGITQIQVDRRHGLTYTEGIRGALRLDPDYLLLGEIREPDDARAAVEAAGTGRVLMSTIHSADAVGTITSLRNRGLADHEIATSVHMVVSQRLVRRLCRRCRRREELTNAQYQWLESAGLPKTITHASVADGCEDCRGLGYDGRVGVFEVWKLTDGDYSRILTHADERTLRANLNPLEHRTLLQDGFAKVEQGITSLKELAGVPHP